ncbi:MAG: ATP-binding cassette domain-containing protein [Alistipes sp.]|nr:ATP-binding cassette domain-containing protein [Alistipes sp.]
MDILTVSNISKRFGSVRALQEVSFSVPEGSVYGILGPNGSGKTTLLGIVTDVIRADSGSYALPGSGTAPNYELRKKIGTLLETPNFYGYLSGYDNLLITANIKGVSREEIDPVLVKVDLYERRFSKFGNYSLGMKQRLGIASALLGDPQVLILDEPTNGLDPEGIAEIRNLVRELGASGHTVVIASHLLDEVEKVCTHAAILKSGRLLADGRVDEIMARGDTVEMSAADTPALMRLLADNFPGERLAADGETVLLTISEGHADTGAINSLCHANGIVLTKLALRKLSMESKFLEIISETRNDSRQ